MAQNVDKKKQGNKGLKNGLSVGVSLFLESLAVASRLAELHDRHGGRLPEALATKGGFDHAQGLAQQTHGLAIAFQHAANQMPGFGIAVVGHPMPAFEDFHTDTFQNRAQITAVGVFV